MSDRPNPESNPHPPDPEKMLAVTQGHATLAEINDQPIIVFTLTGYQGETLLRIQVAYRPDDWDAQVAFVERMRKRNPAFPQAKEHP